MEEEKKDEPVQPVPSEKTEAAAEPTPEGKPESQDTHPVTGMVLGIVSLFLCLFSTIGLARYMNYLGDRAEGKATAEMLYSLPSSILTILIINGIGLALAIFAFVYSRKAHDDGRGRTGFITSLIALPIHSIFFILNLVLLILTLVGVAMTGSAS